jgi:hypothetical protein
MNNQLTVIQYNCGHSNAHVSRALFNSFSHPQVLTIQEPQFNQFTLSTYCLKLYELAYEATLETRVYFMIKRDVGAAQWRRKQYGPNVASLTLLTNPDALTIINVYNPRERGPRIKE